MGFFKRKRPGASRRKAAIPDGVWMKCDGCRQMITRTEVEENLQVCPLCGRHYRIGARKRIDFLVDPGSFEETHAGLCATDPLGFSVGEESYADRLQRVREQTGLGEALVTGFAAIEGRDTALGVMDAGFIMASMSGALGEKFCRLVDDAVDARRPVTLVAASGGARMQEGTLALMQMAKTANAVRTLNEARLPYIVVLTDPTSGGVFASFAGLGDIMVAEPGAYIGFAGARLIEGALKVKLPSGFQSAEYQLENGFLDDIVKRTELRGYLGRLLQYLTPSPKTASAGAPPRRAAHVDAAATRQPPHAVGVQPTRRP